MNKYFLIPMIIFSWLSVSHVDALLIYGSSEKLQLVHQIDRKYWPNGTQSILQKSLLNIMFGIFFGFHITIDGYALGAGKVSDNRGVPLSFGEIQELIEGLIPPNIPRPHLSLYDYLSGYSGLIAILFICLAFVLLVKRSRRKLNVNGKYEI